VSSKEPALLNFGMELELKYQNHIMFKRILVSIGVLTSALLSAQNDSYKFQVNNLKDTVVYLASYYGEKLYYADTAYADGQGNFSFGEIAQENQGKYAVVIPGPRYFEIVIADNEEIKIETDTADLTGNLKVLQSENNKILYDYMGFLTERRKERELLLEKLEENEGEPEITKAIKTEYNALNEKVAEYQRNIAVQNPNKYAAKEIYMAVEPEPPANLREDKTKAYYYYKQHYFDNIDLKDDRIIRSPVFHGRLDNYLNKTLIQNPDTVAKAMDDLIDKLEPGSEVFKYVVHYSTYSFETSKIMGMDKAFVHMVDNYYKPDLAFWMDEEKLETIKEKANQKRNTLIGDVIPELILMDTLGNWISSHKDLEQKYVLIYFYDPDCGHCKKESPKLAEFYKDFDQDLLGIYAVSSETGEKWTDFIKKNKMDFFNVAIPKKAYEDAEYATSLITSRKTNYTSLKYQETYDVYSTPKILLVDQDRVIRAKDIGVDQIGDFINRLEGIGIEEPGKEEMDTVKDQ